MLYKLIYIKGPTYLSQIPFSVFSYFFQVLKYIFLILSDDSFYLPLLFFDQFSGFQSFIAYLITFRAFIFGSMIANLPHFIFNLQLLLIIHVLLLKFPADTFLILKFLFLFCILVSEIIFPNRVFHQKFFYS